MLMRMRHAKPMQFVVAVVTTIMAVPVGMAMFVNVSVTMRVRMYNITMSVLVGVFVRMQMLVRVRVSFLMVVIVLLARHIFTSALSFVIQGYESLGEQSSGPGLACAPSGNHRHFKSIIPGI